MDGSRSERHGPVIGKSSFAGRKYIPWGLNFPWQIGSFWSCNTVCKQQKYPRFYWRWLAGWLALPLSPSSAHTDNRAFAKSTRIRTCRYVSYVKGNCESGEAGDEIKMHSKRRMDIRRLFRAPCSDFLTIYLSKEFLLGCQIIWISVPFLLFGVTEQLAMPSDSTHSALNCSRTASIRNSAAFETIYLCAEYVYTYPHIYVYHSYTLIKGMPNLWLSVHPPVCPSVLLCLSVWLASLLNWKCNMKRIFQCWIPSTNCTTCSASSPSVCLRTPSSLIVLLPMHAKANGCVLMWEPTSQRWGFWFHFNR